MVKIVSLRAENFRRLNLKNPLTLPEGFVIIRGRNEAGKSTILEAILFGLYGDFRIPAALRGGRQGLESLVNHRAGRAEVEVTFEVSGRRYRVERVIEADREGARQVDARLAELAGEGAKLLATGVSRGNEMIQKLIRVSWREMLATNVIAQKDLERILRLDRSDRERIINMMMGFESYNKAIERLGEEARELRRNLEAARRELSSLADRVRDLEERGEKLKEWEAELAELKERLPQLEEVADRERVACEYLRELETTLMYKHELKLQLAAMQRERANLTEMLRRSREKLEATLRELEELQKGRRELDPKLKEAEEELKRVESELKKLIEVRAKLEGLWSSYLSATRELEELRGKEASLKARTADKARLEGERKHAEESLASIERALRAVRLPKWSLAGAATAVALSAALIISYPALAVAGLAAAALFITAGFQIKQRRARELERRESELRGRISEIIATLRVIERDEEEMEALKRRESAVIESINALQSQLQAVALELGPGEDYQAIVERASKLVAAAEARKAEVLEKRSSLERAASELETSIAMRREELAGLQKEIEALEAKLAKLDSSIHELESEYTGVPVPEPPFEIEGLTWPVTEDDVKAVSEVRHKHEDLHSELRANVEAVKAKVESLERQIGETRRELEKLPGLKAKLHELEKSVKGTEHELRARELAIDALRKVAERRRAAFAPSVEVNMSWIVSFITDGRYKAVRIDPQTYEVEVFDSEAGRWMRRDIYSGGTNDQFLLAMRIAFTLSLLPAAKGTYPRFLFLDEPLGSSDQERRHRIVELLGRELTRFFDQVLLVTHVDIEEPPQSTVIVLEDGRVQEMYTATSSESSG